MQLLFVSLVATLPLLGIRCAFVSSFIIAERRGTSTRSSILYNAKMEDTDEVHLSKSRQVFIDWAIQNAIPIECIQSIQHDDKDQSEPFLSYLSDAVSSASVVMLSEGYHNCKEMMSLHLRIIQHLCTKCDDFHIVGTESGMPESRDIEDYIVSSDKTYSNKEKDIIWKRGLNKMYSAWNEGRELIEWMRTYNIQHQKHHQEQLLHYCGLDIGGFYSDWEYPLSKIQSYLEDQYPNFEQEWSAKIHPILDIMGNTQARYNYQHLLSPSQKATLAVLLDELVLKLSSHIDEFEGDSEYYEWTRQSAISMQLAENYYRNYESMLQSDRGGISKCSGLDGREIAMANTIMWRLGQHMTQKAKMIVINHVIHTKTAVQYQDGVWGHFVPMGQILKQLLADESESSTMFNIGMIYGSGTFWNKWQKPSERYIDTCPPPKDDGLEVVMQQISKEANMPNFFLHWELVPRGAWLFMNKVTTIRENDYFIKACPSEWNACIYMDRATHATPA